MDMRVSNLFKGDKIIWMVLFFFCIISIIEVFSASSHLTYKTSNYIMPIMKHVGTILIGVFFTICVLNIPCNKFRPMTLPLLGFSLLTLLWVLVVGSEVNGAQRQFDVFGVSFQPSELAKGSLVLATAQILSVMQTDKGADKDAMKLILLVAAPLVFLIMIENLSTALLICGVILIMMFIGRVPLAQLGKLIGVCCVFIVLVVSFVFAVGHDGSDAEGEKVEIVAEGAVKEADANFLVKAKDAVFHRADTWKARLMKFFDDKEVAPKDYDIDGDAQVAHANIAIASSNFIGKGPGNSEERDFLSQAFSDFIYAIIIEEMGVVGAGFVAFLYLVLLFRTWQIVHKCESNFPAFLAMGFALLFMVQASFNMMVAVGIVPVTGQPLPLISKGGTSTIFNCIFIGVILSVSRSAKRIGDDSDSAAAAGSGDVADTAAGAPESAGEQEVVVA